jgi:hypothetical protein
MSKNAYLSDEEIDKAAFAELAVIAETSKSEAAPIPVKALSKGVDLSKYLHYIRAQGGGGCWGYAALAAWDIMNEMNCPYSPNLSFRLWLTLHRRRSIWEDKGGVYSPDGRFHKADNVLQSFGCPTEGTELTLHKYPSLWPEPGWSREGVNEASNYRLACAPVKVDPINSTEFMRWLNASYPIIITSGDHIVTVVGYDKQDQKFKYVNSYGDSWPPWGAIMGTGGDGYSFFTFQDLDTGNPNAGFPIPVTAASILKIIPPKPVPAARISFKRYDRSGVHLWLSAEGSPLPRRKIWPQGWVEQCSNLCYTVRLPLEFIWPPSQDNRLVLELYNTTETWANTCVLKEFTAAFGAHVVECSALSGGPIDVDPGEHRLFFIP